jgi:hypothetical protein
MVLGLLPRGEIDARAVIEIIVDKAIYFTAKVVKFFKKIDHKEHKEGTKFAKFLHEN